MAARFTWITRSFAIGGVALVTACGSRTAANRLPEAEPPPDPAYLVLKVSDVPRGFAPVPGEQLRPVALVSVLRDPWSAGYRQLIRTERVSGYEASFWRPTEPERQAFQCEVAVYRSIGAARKVFTLRARSFASFIAARRMGRAIAVRRVGQATSAFRLYRGWKGFVVSWRYRNTLARCSGGPGTLRRTVDMAVLQQRRLERLLG